MAERIFNVLFLGATNSARSLIAETLLNHLGNGRFRAFSAGSLPSGAVNPLVVEMLAREGLPTDALRSKSWDEFSQPNAPPLDFVITVCDTVAGAICPVWPGQPTTAHWSIEDPAAVDGDEQARLHAVQMALRRLSHRIVLFVSLPFAHLDALSLQHRLDEIGGLPAREARPEGVPGQLGR